MQSTCSSLLRLLRQLNEKFSGIREKVLVLFSYFVFVSLDLAPQCAQELLLALFSGIIPGRLIVPYAMPGIEPGSATCKERALPAVLSLWPRNRTKDLFLRGNRKPRIALPTPTASSSLIFQSESSCPLSGEFLGPFATLCDPLSISFYDVLCNILRRHT